MDKPRIVRIEWGCLLGQRPRNLGCNARRGEHGATVRVPIARVTVDDGSSGFGLAGVTRDLAEKLLGACIYDVFTPGRGPDEVWKPIEFPLWDLFCKRAGVPGYVAAAEAVGITPPSAPFRVPCYDTSLYIDDLHLSGIEEAAALLADEARQGYEKGQRAFKLKVGRGARWLSLEEGTRRDIAIIRSVRAAMGPDAAIMVDANNGYNLNLTKRVLAETADCGLFWVEEPFHEDAALYRDLREWMEREGLKVLIADGEGDASPNLMDWARDHVIDVIQRDIVWWGFTSWLPLAKQLDDWECRTAPHHYGTLYGNYALCHLAGASRNFVSVEWDEATAPGLAAPGYAIVEGRVTVPDAPGFGLEIAEVAFRQVVRDEGFEVAV